MHMKAQMYEFDGMKAPRLDRKNGKWLWYQLYTRLYHQRQTLEYVPSKWTSSLK